MFPSQMNHISQGLNYRSNIHNLSKETKPQVLDSKSSVGSLIEGFEDSNPINKESEELIQYLTNLEARFNETLNKYSRAYENVIQHQLDTGEDMRTNDNLGVNIVDSNGNYFYINKFGEPMKYANKGALSSTTPLASKAAYDKRHMSCPTPIKFNMTTGTDNEIRQASDLLNGANGSVYLAEGVPCNIIGKNVRNKDTKEIYFITEKGIKRKFLDFANHTLGNCSRTVSFELSNDIMKLIPSGTDIANVDSEEGCKVGLENVSDVDLAVSYNNELENIIKELLDSTEKINSTDGTLISQIQDKRSSLHARLPSLTKERKTFIDLKKRIQSSRATIDEMKANNSTNMVMYLSLITMITVIAVMLYARGVEPTLLGIFYLTIAVVVFFIFMEGFDGTVEKGKLMVSAYV
jgi:hypothetical protein